MSQTKLTYFNCKGIGEVIRMLFKYGNIDFIDYRFEDESWPEIKPHMPFGQVPILEENNKVGYQSIALARYLAKKVKLVGNNEWEDMEIDAIVDTINDFREKLANYHYAPNDSIKEAFKGPLFEEIIPFYLAKFEKIAKNNDGHLALNKLTWADFYFVGMHEYLNYMTEKIEKNILEDYPNLNKVVQNVFSIPAIKKWVETRPVTVN